MSESADAKTILSDASHPAWSDEAQVALKVYRKLRASPDQFPDAALVDEEDLLHEAASWTALDHHPLGPAVIEGGVAVRGTAFNELHRRYDFGAGETQDFHVQGVAVGADASGNYFLKASVGCEGKRPDGEVEVLAMFIGTIGLVGAIRWIGHLGTNEEMFIRTTGHDPRLAAGFEALTQVQLRFSVSPHLPG